MNFILLKVFLLKFKVVCGTDTGGVCWAGGFKNLGSHHGGHGTCNKSHYLVCTGSALIFYLSLVRLVCHLCVTYEVTK